MKIAIFACSLGCHIPVGNNWCMNCSKKRNCAPDISDQMEKEIYLKTNKIR